MHPELSRFFEEMKGSLLDDGDLTVWGPRTASGLNVYRRLMYNRVSTTLGPTYPRTQARLDRETWRLFVEASLEKLPTDRFERAALCRAFPQTVGELTPTLELAPYLAELAALEWLWAQAAAEPVPEGAARPGAVNPTLRRLLTRFALLELFAAGPTSAEPPALLQEPEELLVWRELDTDRVRMRPLDAPLALVLDMAQGGATIDELAALGVMSRPQLNTLFEDARSDKILL
jgi:hypothetical protein